MVVADTWALATGRLSMGGGYVIWHDVLVGQALLWLALVFYELARRRWHLPADPSQCVSHMRRLPGVLRSEPPCLK
jgi:hypothetical protein